MEIKRSSWHYNLNTFFCSRVEKYNTLCSYFWRTFASVMVAVTIIILLIAISTIYGIILTDFYIDSHPNIMLAEQTLFVRRIWQFPIGVIGIIITFFSIKYTGILITGLWTKITGTIKFISLMMKKLSKTPIKTISKEPSLIIEMIKAKKKKYCPVIEFKGKR